jgi:tetraacyldisaccharide 4'-kinase
MFRDALGGSSVYAGASKRALAGRAASDGRRLVLVDDGFSHWGLDRDLDVVLLDAGDPWGGRRLVPAGRLREPLRALQRAGVVVITRVAAGADPARTMEEVAGFAPAARIGVARHRVVGVRVLAGDAPPPRRVWVVTATGNPAAVEASAREAGLEVAGLSSYRDHHWFTAGEARMESERARAAGATILLTAKDAVRWPEAASREGVSVLEVEWEWLGDSARLDELILGAGGAA